MLRRAARMARPARVRIRSRNPWVLARRRLLGWKVRLPLLTSVVSRYSLPCGHPARQDEVPGSSVVSPAGSRPVVARHHAIAGSRLSTDTTCAGAGTHTDEPPPAGDHIERTQQRPAVQISTPVATTGEDGAPVRWSMETPPCGRDGALLASPAAALRFRGSDLSKSCDPPGSGRPGRPTPGVLDHRIRALPCALAHAGVPSCTVVDNPVDARDHVHNTHALATGRIPPG